MLTRVESTVSPGACGPLLASRWPLDHATLAHRAALVGAVAVLTAIAAQVSVPLPWTPVPLSLQTLAVLLGAASVGARLAASGQVLYLALGLLGLPVFAASGILPQGAARLLGPTGGYLLAFPVAAWVVGRLAERGWGLACLHAVPAFLAGWAIIIASGVVWLAVWPAAPLGWRDAWLAGAQPFLVIDALKVAAAATLLPVGYRLLRPPTVPPV